MTILHGYCGLCDCCAHEVSFSYIADDSDLQKLAIWLLDRFSRRSNLFALTETFGNQVIALHCLKASTFWYIWNEAYASIIKLHDVSFASEMARSILLKENEHWLALLFSASFLKCLG